MLANFETYRMLTNFLTMVAHGSNPHLAANAREGVAIAAAAIDNGDAAALLDRLKQHFQQQ